VSKSARKKLVLGIGALTLAFALVIGLVNPLPAELQADANHDAPLLPR
jgi:hypothetical protein